MKYSEMKYVRPDINEVGKKFSQLINSFKNAKSFEEEDTVIGSINDLKYEFDSMSVMAELNYSIDTTNENYEEEYAYFDNSLPVFEDYANEFYKVLVSCKYKEQLIEKYGKQLFVKAELKNKCLNNSIVEDLQEENRLVSEYLKIRASAKINFDGKERNLTGLMAFMESDDKETRKKAFDAYWKFYSDNSKCFDELFDKLVKLRNNISDKLGSKNFVETGYARMERSDYDQKNVEQFRKNILKYFVPLATKLSEKQRKRLSLEKLMIYDIPIQFNSGNATPKGNSEWIMDNGKIMYDELSQETSEFFDFMVENELMDLENRQGKALGGFCDLIAKYKSPYIFANMNGTSGDITVLTHEAGHAFQTYKSRNIELIECQDPTSDACEIHSMSMEFLTYPWMNLFFKDDTNKFKYSHIIESVNFLPYGVLVDHFQHWVYENPLVSPDERKSKWRELEKIYMPYLEYGDNDFLESGGRWQRQSHIYGLPFYYIDYCLAQICAFQYWSKAIMNGDGEFKKVLGDYIKLCEAGGSMSFLELVKYGNLESPFEESVIKKLAKEIETYIDSIDDSKF
jgi:M3 family oligoendopeptidase